MLPFGPGPTLPSHCRGHAMSIVSRRDFLIGASSTALGTAAAGLYHPARAAMRPEDKFDLVIKGGEVLDPSQTLRAGATSASATASSRRSKPTFRRAWRCARSTPPASW